MNSKINESAESEAQLIILIAISVIVFVVIVALTCACMNYRIEQRRQNESEDNEKSPEGPRDLRELTYSDMIRLQNKQTNQLADAHIRKKNEAKLSGVAVPNKATPKNKKK